MVDKLTNQQRHALRGLQCASDEYGRLPIDKYSLCKKAGIYLGSVTRLLRNLCKRGFVVWVPGHWQLTQKGIDYREGQSK